MKVPKYNICDIVFVPFTTKEHIIEGIQINEGIRGKEDVCYQISEIPGPVDERHLYSTKEEALEILKPASNLEEADVLNTAGEVLRKKGKYDEALEYHRKALAIFKTDLGPEHPKVAEALNNIGAVFGVQGERSTAREYYSKAAVIEKKGRV